MIIEIDAESIRWNSAFIIKCHSKGIGWNFLYPN